MSTLYSRKTKDVYILRWNGEDIDEADTWLDCKYLLLQIQKLMDELNKDKMNEIFKNIGPEPLEKSFTFPIVLKKNKSSK